MSWEWLCNSKKAQEQLEICKLNNCPDCEKCVAIHESSVAMEEYGRVAEPDTGPDIEHPLYDYVMDKFGGTEIE